jgi:hypothetical protein
MNGLRMMNYAKSLLHYETEEEIKYWNNNRFKKLNNHRVLHDIWQKIIILRYKFNIKLVTKIIKIINLNCKPFQLLLYGLFPENSEFNYKSYGFIIIKPIYHNLLDTIKIVVSHIIANYVITNKQFTKLQVNQFFDNCLTYLLENIIEYNYFVKSFQNNYAKYYAKYYAKKGLTTISNKFSISPDTLKYILEYI